MSEQLNCFICGTPLRLLASEEYIKCNDCGHQLRASDQKQTLMVNDILSIEEVEKKGLLDRFKKNVIRSIVNQAGRDQLADIGAGSGKFLHHNQSAFRNVTAIEVSPLSKQFMVECLGITVKEEPDELPKGLNIVTAWHSLEHMPINSLDETLSCIKSKLNENGRLVVSVPNISSFQSNRFGAAFPYYDLENHIHQFSYESLIRLLEKHGFVPENIYFSFYYNLFGNVQGLLNQWTDKHNYLYYKHKRGYVKSSILHDFFHYALLVPSGLLGATLMLKEIFVPAKRGVLTLCLKHKNYSR
jgi:hypothetical protein